MKFLEITLRLEYVSVEGRVNEILFLRLKLFTDVDIN